ncbi:MAG: transcriptional regulator, AraC family protein [Labilithrix sp.]|nr:transcriptional regulator, AraC family protein [Labilithrix sp.]
MSQDAIDMTLHASRGPTVLATVVRGTVELAAAVGIDRAALLVRLGLTDAELADPERFLPLEAHTIAWEALAALPNVETLALDLALHIKVDLLGVVGWAFANAPTARDALGTIRRYGQLFGDPYVPEIELDDRSLTVHRVFEPRIARTRVMPEYAPASTLVLLRDLTGMSADDELALEVWFQHPPPADPSRHERFFGCPVRFSAPETRLVLARAAVERPVLRRNPSLYEYLDRHARALASQSGEAGPSFAERVRRYIAEELKGREPSQADVARALGTSERTLQRRLKDEGRTFAEILDAVRRELASRYLGDPKLAIYEIAFLLGYAETSSFHRAFKRWTGEGPNEFRLRTRSR